MKRTSKKLKVFLLIFLLGFLIIPWLLVVSLRTFPKFLNTVQSLLQIKSQEYDGPIGLFNREVIKEESVVIDVVEDVSDSVVSVVVKTVNFDFFSGPSLSEEGIGTGFIVDSDGLVVTNSHVVDDLSGEYSIVTKSGETYEVLKIHRDTATDLAILEVSGDNLPQAELGDSDALKVGQTAIAIGNALGKFQNTVTVGVVSGVARQLRAYSSFGESKVYENVIQTDAALNPGNSGGPLLNTGGQVIGINVATSFGADNISFAIPVNVLRPILQSFLVEGKIVKPYLGVSYTMISRGIASLRRMPEGAFVSRVIPDSPADAAGLKRGDIITKIGDEELGSETSLALVLGTKKVGERVVLTVDREGDELSITVVLGDMPDNS